MKTLMLLISFVMVLGGIGCGKKKDAPVSNSYQQGYGYTSNANYSWNGSGCYQNQNYQQVDPQYCTSQQQQGSYPNQQGGYPNQTGSTQKQCFGQYYYMGNGQPQLGQCNGTNCRGYLLYEVATSSWVQCM